MPEPTRPDPQGRLGPVREPRRSEALPGELKPLPWDPRRGPITDAEALGVLRRRRRVELAGAPKSRGRRSPVPAELPGADAHDLALWRWLRAYAGAPSPSHPPLWMGYGEDDRFVMSNRLVAAVLPPAQVFTTEGGHQWAPWRRLWARFLDRAPWAGAPR